MINFYVIVSFVDTFSIFFDDKLSVMKFSCRIIESRFVLLRLHETHNSFAIAFVLLLLLLVFLPALSGISGNSEQKIILQTIEQLIQYTDLEIQFWSLKYKAVISIRKNLDNSPFISK